MPTLLPLLTTTLFLSAVCRLPSAAPDLSHLGAYAVQVGTGLYFFGFYKFYPYRDIGSIWRAYDARARDVPVGRIAYELPRYVISYEFE